MTDMQNSAKFIEFPAPFDPAKKEYDPAFVFKKQFSLSALPERAELGFIALGIGYVYINGKPLSGDLFNTPVSDYNKTIWYHPYDAAKLLRCGENEITVIVGNGWYNESLDTAWNFHFASWRAAPKLKLWMKLPQGDLVTDESWTVSTDASPSVFNQLRSGETYDCRRGEAFLEFGKGGYLPVQISENPPVGVLKECPCPPIREFETYSPVAVFKNKDGHTVYDFGQNLAGYLKLTLRGKEGDVITLRHGERVFADGTLDHREMDGLPFHNGHDFQTNRVILSGGVDCPITRFTYHGFRFVIVEGECEILDIKSVFVHQAVDKYSEFDCSVPLLNQISRCGDFSVWSNMYYALTDCPTREKLGWTNDAIASAEQILMNFDSAGFFDKWFYDILDANLPDGNLYSVVPSGGWGTWECTGPMCTGIIFKMPFLLYSATGDQKYIKEAYPYMTKHLDYMLKMRTSDGLIGYGLADWNGGDNEKFRFNSAKFIDTALITEFAYLTVEAAKICGFGYEWEEKVYKSLYNRFFEVFYDCRGDRCVINTQTAIAMTIYLKEGGATKGLAAQLSQAVADCDYHHECGMVGLQYLIPVLDQIGRSDLVYKIMTAKGYPSYSFWMEDGATTLYEMWNTHKSANHHMNSSAVAWFMKKLVGLAQKQGFVGYKSLTVCPYFPEDMNFCRGKLRDCATAEWKRNGDEIHYHLTISDGISAEVISPEGYTSSLSGEISAGKYDIIFKKQ